MSEDSARAIIDSWYQELERTLLQMTERGLINRNPQPLVGYVVKPRPEPMESPKGLIFRFDESYPLLDAQVDAIAKDHDDHFWPHKGGCPMCGSDAYVGFAHVECSNGGCRNFVWKEGM